MLYSSHNGHALRCRRYSHRYSYSYSFISTYSSADTRADEFSARSPDELSLRRGDRIELVERDDDFGDGWFLGKNTESGENGLFPEGM